MSDVQLRNIDVAEFDRRWQLVFVQLLEELQDVSDAGQVDRVLPGQLLDRLQLHDVSLGEAPPVGRRALGNDETQVLEQFIFQQRVHHSIGTDLSTGFEYRPLLSNNASALIARVFLDGVSCGSGVLPFSGAFSI